MAHSSLILIPKPGKEEMRSIGLTDSIWKICSRVIANRINDTVKWHKSIHGFRNSKGTGTATLEVKLMASLSEHKGDTIFQVFLDLKKAFDSISRAKLMEIMNFYGVGERLMGIIKQYWSEQIVALQQRGYYGTCFKPERGVTQGDVLSPTLFNLAINYVVERLDQGIETSEGTRLKSMCIFYADDGYLGGHNADKVQDITTEATNIFKTLGLEVNVNKTKAMVNDIHKRMTGMTEESYARRWNQDLPTYLEKQNIIVQCPHCQKHMKKASLSRHLRFSG